MNSDLIELLAAFENNNVRYLIIGGYAVGFHAEPRYTKDCDIWIATDPENAKAVYDTLKGFGAPLFDATPKDFEDSDAFFFFGEPPNRIDIIMGPPGGDFNAAWENRVTQQAEGTSINFASRADLIALKRAAGRPQDLLDIDMLKQSSLPNDNEDKS